MALGIVSFSFVGLMGLLPVGLSNFRQAVEIQTQSQIEQQIAAEFQLMRFSDLTAGSYLGSFPRYFDERGVVVPASDPGRLYTVTTASAEALDLPGVTISSNTVTVSFGVQKKTAPQAGRTFSLVVANNGH